tara:strand:+ start:275 stop:766 length:492 start_codon:yes stop_codon:yes gene_type:complete
MPSRKYAPKRKLRRTKGRRTRRKYGKKRGGVGGFFNIFGKKNNEESTECEKSCKEKCTLEQQSNNEAQEMEEGNAGLSNTQQSSMEGDIEQGVVPPEHMVGGRRRRRRRASKKRSSKKSRKSRRTRRRHRGGCIGHAFQPSIVNPPNSALANPAPFARYTTGP